MSATYCHKIRVGVILTDVAMHPDKLLLVRQNNQPFWVLPGGTLEPDEGLFECGAREIQEEVSLTVSIERLLYVSDFFTPDGHTLDAFVLGRYVSGEPCMTTEENLDEMGFFTLDEVKTLQMKPDFLAPEITADWSAHFLKLRRVYMGKSDLVGWNR